MREIKKTLSIEEYSALVQMKLDEQGAHYSKDQRAGLLFSFILLAIIFLILPLFNVLPDHINLLTLSGLVALGLLVGSLVAFFKDQKVYHLRKKRYSEIISSIQGYDKIKIHAIESWICVTLSQDHIPSHANERMYRYYELNLFQRIKNDILLMNCYGDLCLIPDSLWPDSKLRQIARWIKEGMGNSTNTKT